MPRFFLLSSEREIFTRVDGLAAKHLFDTHQLVVFADAVGAAGGAGFDLAGAECHGEVGDGGVLGFTGAVRHHGSVVVALRELHGVDGLRERADLVDLDEDGAGSGRRWCR